MPAENLLCLGIQHAKGLKEPKRECCVILHAKTSRQDSGECLGQTQSREGEEQQLRSKSSAMKSRKWTTEPNLKSFNHFLGQKLSV